MGIKLNGFIFFMFLSLSLFAQTEEQRKYAVQDFDELKQFIKNSESLNSLSTHFHTESVYYDIYLDTPDLQLLQNGYSLRFRKRTIKGNSGEVSYTFQLKSEMSSLLGLRMEVEEPELSFYMVQSDSNWIPLTTVLDSIFNGLENPSNIKNNSLKFSMQSLMDWIEFKSEAPVAPFQKLHYLGFLDSGEIKSIQAVTIGISMRIRSHIFTSKAQNMEMDLPKNRIKLNKLPEYFKQNKDANWILESSLDDTRFFDLSPDNNMILNLKEFEVENKYFTPEKGARVLSIFEKDMIRIFNLKSRSESKYKQAMAKILFVEK